MKHIAILLQEGHRLLSAAAVADVFSTLNEFYAQQGQKPPFSLFLIAEEADIASSIPLPVHKYATAPQADIIFIPAFAAGQLPSALEQNAPLVPWLAMQNARGASLASCCTGAFLLALTGLLNGKTATTHPDTTAIFEQLFPEIHVSADEVVTDHDTLYTSGGATSSFILMIHIIRKYCGHEMAIRIANFFAIDPDRIRQTCFKTFSPEYEHGDELVREAQNRIHATFQEAKTIDTILSGIPASRRNLIRRFKAATGLTPQHYLQSIRIEAAKKELRQSNSGITEAMLNAGYNDIKSFRRTFVQHVGLNPKDYRQKYRNKWD